MISTGFLLYSINILQDQRRQVMPIDKVKRTKGGNARGVERPHVWKCGPDPYKHSMYIPFQRVKAQAKYRQEEFELDFEDFYQLWNGYWEQRGRGGDDLVMTRIDWEKAWTKDNITLITRTEQCQKQGVYKQLLSKTNYRTRGMDIHKRKARTK